MKKVNRFFQACIVLLLLLPVSAQNVRGSAAIAENSNPPKRQTEIVISVTQYEWWVIRWSDNFILCRVFTTQEGLPTGSDIFRDCGKSVFDQWVTTPPCPGLAEGKTSECQGVYLHLITSGPGQTTILIELPPPSVWVTLSDCVPSFPENRCPRIPNLLLTAEEPLPNEQITAVHALMNGRIFTCPGATCEIPLRPTSREGVTIEFWAESSFGDESKVYTALVRVIDSGVVIDPGGAGWYVDVISSQWRGRRIASCAQTWQSFPPLGGPPTWLSTPEFTELLATAEDYMFLAGKLIRQGVVDASECPNGGVLPNGYADTCGMEKARPIVEDWQNQFDERIIEVAQETGVPAQLLKNLFAQESQFWPGAFNRMGHLGLGHLTDQGAEVLLLWNRSFFDQFCPLVLHTDACTKGYLNLDPPEQAILRGALALQANADCPECPAGIDLSHTNLTIDLFAQTLLANCDQVGQIVFNASRQRAGAVSNYEDLWKFTLANYHAGPGCLSYAIHRAWSPGSRLTWERVSGQFTPACQGVLGYVDNVAR
jgi:hypothetical protein